MKKYSVILVAVMCILHSFAFSQKTKTVAKPKITANPGASRLSTPAVKKPVIKDTLAYNIQTTINELNSYIRDNSQPVQLIVGSFLGSDLWGNSYSSAIKFPASVENIFRRQKVDRYRGIEQWEWTSTLVRAPKDQLPTGTFISLRSRIDSVIKAMPAVKDNDEKNSVLKISAYDNVSEAQYRHLYNVDEVGIKVQFVKPITQTEQQSIDSLARVYGPGLSNAATAKSAAEKYTGALYDEGFSEERRLTIFADEVRVIADKDIKAAFWMLMGTYLQQKDLTAKLTESQKSDIRRQATDVVNAYNAKWDPPPPPRTEQGSSTYGTQQYTQQNQPQGKRVKCAACLGAGQYEKVTYSHTYDGIYSQVKTTFTKWVTCEFCGGSGWVTKYKKN
jgi:hypothetical protein